MSINKPNAKYDHVYAIVRLDPSYSDGQLPNPNLVMVTKVMSSEERANEEVERLNALNGSKGCQYHCQIARFDPDT